MTNNHNFKQKFLQNTDNQHVNFNKNMNNHTYSSSNT